MADYHSKPMIMITLQELQRSRVLLIAAFDR